MMTERKDASDAPAPTIGAAAAWYAIWTRSHFEQIVSDQLAVKGFEIFLPMATTWIRRAKTRRRSATPLFPSYVFVHHALDKTSHVEVLKARGVVRVLGDRWDRLTPIPHDQIQSIQRIVDVGAPVFPHPLLQAGQRVRMIAGPLEGLEGLLLRGRPDRGLLVISMNLLQRSVAVEVDCTWVEAV